MIQDINGIAPRIWLGLCLAMTSLVSVAASAEGPQGSWKFERTMDYFGRTSNTAPHFTTVAVRANEVALSETCIAKFAPDEYLFSDVFQPLAKRGISDQQLDRFLTQSFNMSLARVKTVYSLTSSPANCAAPVMEFFHVGDRLLIPVGVTFHSYVKSDVAKGNASAESVPLVSANYKLSALPFDYDRYFSVCRPKIVGSKGRPQTTDKCGPDFFPYVADPKSSDALMKIIGNHDYARAGQEYADGFSPPFKQKAAATFLVFPPMKAVTVVRVDDFELVKNEERDVMSGVYLSIVGGKVIDQISGCQLAQDYLCLEDGRAVARLLPSGKFSRP